MSITVMQIRAEDVQVGDVERHVSLQGRLMPWRRVNAVGDETGSVYLKFVYEGGDEKGGAVRRLDLVEVQHETQ